MREKGREAPQVLPERRAGHNRSPKAAVNSLASHLTVIGECSGIGRSPNGNDTARRATWRTSQLLLPESGVIEVFGQYEVGIERREPSTMKIKPKMANQVTAVLQIQRLKSR